MLKTHPAMDDYEFSGELVTGYEDLTGEFCPDASLPFSNIYLPALYFLIFFAGVSGNIFVIMVMKSKQHGGGRLVDIFVLNLAIADLVFVLTLPLWAISAMQDHHWAFGDGLCKFSSFVIAVNRFSNILFLTCMSVDRYMAVMRMLEYRFLRTSGRVRLASGVVWGLSFSLGAPALIFRQTVEIDEGGRTLCMDDSQSLAFQWLSIATLFLTFVIPVLIILFCYGSILSRLRRRTGPQKPLRDARRCRQSVKIVFAIVAAFVFSWLPFNFFKTVLIGSQMQGVVLSCWAQSLLTRGLVLSSCLAFFNSCANPAIYMFLDQHFRKRAGGLCLGTLGGRLGGRRRLTLPSSLTFGTSDTRSESTITHVHHFSKQDG